MQYSAWDTEYKITCSVCARAHWIWGRISRKTVEDIASVSMGHQWKMAYGELIGHVIVDVTGLWKVKFVISISLGQIISTMAGDSLDSVTMGYL